MDRLNWVVRSHFKKHWRTIACQIKAINDSDNPKRGFLYDCGAINVNNLMKLIRELKQENIICKDFLIATIQDDIFILNLRKFHLESSHVIVEISGSLKKPRIIEETASFAKMFLDINNQLLSCEDEAIELKIIADWCVPTIFGYLINYPVLYYHNDHNGNCLGTIDLKVHQVKTIEDTLISFSVPNEIFEQSMIVQKKILQWMQYFQTHENFSIKTFVANYPIVIL